MLEPGHVIDLYDDAEGSLIRDGHLLEKHGELQIPTPSEVKELPDREFALVVFSKTGGKHRKYPVHTPDSVILSTHYFEKQGSNFPSQAKTVTEANLLKAHLRFGIEPPEFLKAAASAKVVGPYVNEADMEFVGPTLRSGPPIKLAFALEKVMEDGRKVLAFPLDTKEDTISSVSEFKKVAFEFPGRDRAMVACRLVQRMKELGERDEELEKMAAFEPNPAFLTHIRARRDALAKDEEKEELDKLANISGVLSGPYLAAALEDFDRRTGLAFHWDLKIRNPWDSCFQMKQASVKVGDKTITKNALLALAESGKLASIFSQSSMKSFKENPMEAFSSLPNPTKELISGMID